MASNSGWADLAGIVGLIDNHSNKPPEPLLHFCKGSWYNHVSACPVHGNHPAPNDTTTYTIGVDLASQDGGQNAMVSAILNDSKPKITTKQSYNDSIPSKFKDWHGSYYGEVGRALGFTQAEVSALVHANDSGLSFATIAALIEEHPPVYSSAMTATRKEQEVAFVKNVTAAVTHHQGGAAQSLNGIDFLNYPPSQKKFFVGGDIALKPAPAWKTHYATLSMISAPALHTYYASDMVLESTSKGYDDALMALALQGFASNAQAYHQDADLEGNVYANIAKTGAGGFDHWTGQFQSALLPKPGELAKLMGFWLP